tara:strand:+ start:730 stop:1065 length:336 start_codon:yes stop_codon:yes gene_type:complete
MSEIYRQMREGTEPTMSGEKCDAATNPLVDDCRGMICDACSDTHKPVDEVLGTCKAMSPCTFSLLWANVLEQCIGIDEKYEAELATVKAINELSKSGKIEVYDTGDAWISC